MRAREHDSCRGHSRIRRALRALACAAAIAWGSGQASALHAAGGEYVYVLRWTTRPDQDLLSGSAYTAWARSAIPRCLAVPGLAGLTTYRAAAGEPHIITLFGFPTFSALAGWRASREIEQLTEEARRFTYEIHTEVWGPSPHTPVRSDSSARAPAPAGHVLYVIEWDVFPGKQDDYRAWIARTLATWAAGPGVESVGAHRIVVGMRTDVFTCEFPSFEAWAKWYESEAIQRTRAESRELVVDTRTELWGPNPLYPERLGGPPPKRP